PSALATPERKERFRACAGAHLPGEKHSCRSRSWHPCWYARAGRWTGVSVPRAPGLLRSATAAAAGGRHGRGDAPVSRPRRRRAAEQRFEAKYMTDKYLNLYRALVRQRERSQAYA